MYAHYRTAIAGFLLLVFSSLCTGLPSLPTLPILPSEDPFYVAPKGFNKQPRGTILRTRTLPGIQAAANVQSVYQLLYRTQNVLGQPSVSVTTVVIPINANFTRHLSYQMYYDEADWDCSPSYALQIGATSNATAGDIEEIELFTQDALDLGIPVSLPDYEGEKAAYTAGPQAAYCVLDSIRAVLSSTSLTGILSTAETAMFGYSGGSLATEWAAEYHSTYAPELKILGAALGGLPVNLTTAFIANNGTSTAGLVVAATNGLASGYPSFAKCLKTALFPKTANEFYQAKQLCQTGVGGATGGYSNAYNNINVFSFFKQGIGFLSSSCWTTLVNTAGLMGMHAVPKGFPLYIYKGTEDQIVPSIEETDALVQKYCSHNASVTYVRYLNGTHVETGVQGSPFALEFLFGLFMGQQAPTGCNITDVQAVKSG